MSVRARLPVPGFILGFDDYAAPAERLAAHLNVPFERIAVHRFPDGESRVTVPVPLPAHGRDLSQPRPSRTTSSSR